MKPRTHYAKIVRSEWSLNHPPMPDEPTRQELVLGASRALREMADLLRTSEGQHLLETNPEFREVVVHTHEIAQRIGSWTKFLTAGDRAATRYPITAERFWDLFVDQEFACAICRTAFVPEHGPRMVVDHNHDTGEVRGILCPACNTALGLFKDSPDVLDTALQYLEDKGCYGTDSMAEDQ